jgi:hypothetical protein
MSERVRLADTSGMGAAALDLAVQLGFRVVPLFEPIGDFCSCRTEDCRRAGKHPRVSAWREQASRQPDVISRWWLTNPEANVGVATGVDSGVLVLDVDDRSGGPASLASLYAEHGIPDTLSSLTGGG